MVAAAPGSRAPRGFVRQLRLAALALAEIATDNSGNMIWDLGARMLLDPNATELVSLAEPPHTAAVHAVLMPTANILTNLSRYKIFKGYTTFMTKVAKQQNTPIMLVGLGSQVQYTELRPSDSGDGEDSEAGLDVAGASQIKLFHEQINFLKRVQLSGGFVSARGRFTAAIMTANGLPPPLVLGCPSLLINHNPRLGATLQQKWDAVLGQRTSKLRLAVTLPAVPAERKAIMQPVIKLLAERIFKVFPNSVVVLQTKRDLSILDALRIDHGVCLKEGRVRYYYDPQSWFDGLESCCDFVFSFRIHGTMAGVAAEVPGIVVATDLRINELADAMAIPSVILDKAKLNPDTFDLFEFIESVPSFGDKFDVRRREVAREYAREFERLGIPLNPGIARLADA
ncbi:expressed protein [Chlorella variabilis]|uniref:Expressed protein n=1 Tax=Chlorella variabilis TaxID=554065 RepID=E1ZPI2_CHLVA|nr:expressed protein [Chlorella variabilis]EFN52327.1 expressed protein [Chlorella variabilis]|eukprot:XP_005844429.1 expressed protein [Chlorella variabilis]